MAWDAGWGWMGWGWTRWSKGYVLQEIVKMYLELLELLLELLLLLLLLFLCGFCYVPAGAKRPPIIT